MTLTSMQISEHLQQLEVASPLLKLSETLIPIIAVD